MLSAIPVGSLFQRHPYSNDYTGFQYPNESITRLQSLPLKLYILANHSYLSNLLIPYRPNRTLRSSSSSNLLVITVISVHRLAGVHWHVILQPYGIHCLTVFVALLYSLPSVNILRLISFLLNTCIHVIILFLPFPVFFSLNFYFIYLFYFVLLLVLIFSYIFIFPL